MRSKFAIIIFFLILCTQKVILTSAESDYTESITLILDVDPSLDCSAMAWFTFRNLGRPLNLFDFQSEPSFLGLGITVQFFTGFESTSVTISLNESKVSENQGMSIAYKMVNELERDFGLPPLLYTIPTSGQLGTLSFDFTANSSSTELKDIFMESLPSQGFRQILASMLSNRYNYTMSIGLGKEGGWSIQIFCGGGNTKLVLDQEQIISLKEITGHSGRIVSASESSSSTIYIAVNNQIRSEYDLVVTPITPSLLTGGYMQDGMTQYEAYYDVTGNSLEDFSISLKVMFSGITTTVLIVLAMIITATVSIIIIIRHRRHP
jgi:hypothetical protein